MKFDEIAELCHSLSYEIVEESQNRIKIFTDNFSGINIEFEIEKSQILNFRFFVRTLDIIHTGDRTDIHLIISMMFSIFLQKSDLGISCSIYEYPHPVIENEVYGCYLIPEQMILNTYCKDENDINKKITRILFNIKVWSEVFWGNMGCPCNECMKKLKVQDQRNYIENPILADTIKNNFKRVNNLNYGVRAIPNWEYINDFDNELILIKSVDLCSYIDLITNNDNVKNLKSLNGVFFIENDKKYFLKKTHINKVNKIIKELNPHIKPNSIKYNLLENLILINDKEYIIGYKKYIGIEAFKLEKEKVREKHNIESQLLFPINKFEWCDLICPDQFESLIKKLLEREPNVGWVRKPAPLNQADKGRDLIIEMYIKDEKAMSNNNAPIKKIKVVGQCKASKNTLGTSQVSNIRDTVELHNSNGYFLAVSNQITLTLTETLEKLKEKMWVDWWNRDEIEIRLNRNQDLIPLFPKVIKYKSLIKYVNKE